MLNNSGLNKNLWPEAICCAIYALNRVVNSSDQTRTPYELWYGSKPNVKNLRVFGEVAVLKKPDHKITGWDEKGAKAIFVNYTDKFNTYKFLENDKLVIACDAIFLNKMVNNNLM